MANDAAGISSLILSSRFDRLFDQNSNRTVDPGEFESLFVLRQDFDTYKTKLSHENLHRLVDKRGDHISFNRTSIQKRKREKVIYIYLEFYHFVKCGH